VSSDLPPPETAFPALTPGVLSHDAAPGELIRSQWRAENPAKAGSPCANCGALLDGPFCGVCGQAAEDFQKSIGVLLGEAVEHLSDVDGRLLHTIPSLILRPATLTRDYLAGRRASQTAPLRMFLVIVVIFFFAGSLKDFVQPSSLPWYKPDHAAEQVPSLKAGPDALSRTFVAWLNPRLAYAVRHQREFGAAFESWLHEIPIVFLPIATLLLGLLFVFDRRFVLFDHAIFSMHSLSFMGLLFTLTTLMEMGPLSSMAGLVGMAAPVHLFVHLRGVYGTSVAGTLGRMFVLAVLSLIAVMILMVATVGLGLSAMGTGAP
jgi:hypothetical protein